MGRFVDIRLSTSSTNRESTEGVFGLNRRWVPSDFQFGNFEKSYGFVVYIGQK
jgi:hypothetical protein